jgi:hypothetical protein
VLAGAQLTHTAATSSTAYRLDLTLRDGLWIDPASKIDVSERGYVSGHTHNNATTGAATDGAGAGYGGLGATGSYNSWVGKSNPVYGSYQDPDEPGSGGAPGYGPGSAGGGFVRITAAAAQIDGAILANGAIAVNGGAGSGAASAWTSRTCRVLAVG